MPPLSTHLMHHPGVLILCENQIITLLRAVTETYSNADNNRQIPLYRILLSKGDIDGAVDVLQYAAILQSIANAMRNTEKQLLFVSHEQLTADIYASCEAFDALSRLPVVIIRCSNLKSIVHDENLTSMGKQTTDACHIRHDEGMMGTGLFNEGKDAYQSVQVDIMEPMNFEKNTGKKNQYNKSTGYQQQKQDSLLVFIPKLPLSVEYSPIVTNDSEHVYHVLPYTVAEMLKTSPPVDFQDFNQLMYSIIQGCRQRRSFFDKQYIVQDSRQDIANCEENEKKDSSTVQGTPTFWINPNPVSAQDDNNDGCNEDDDEWELPDTLSAMQWKRTCTTQEGPMHVCTQSLLFQEDGQLTTLDGLVLHNCYISGYGHLSLGSDWQYVREELFISLKDTPPLITGVWDLVAQSPSANMPISRLLIEVDDFYRVSGWACICGDAASIHETHSIQCGIGNTGDDEDAITSLFYCHGVLHLDMCLLHVQNTVNHSTFGALFLRFHPDGFLQGTWTKKSVSESIVLRFRGWPSICQRALGALFPFGYLSISDIISTEKMGNLDHVDVKPLTDVLLLVQLVSKTMDMNPLVSYLRSWTSKHPLPPSTFVMKLLSHHPLVIAHAMIPPPNDTICDRISVILPCSDGDIEEMVALAATACPWMLGPLLDCQVPEVAYNVSAALCSIATASPGDYSPLLKASTKQYFSIRRNDSPFGDRNQIESSDRISTNLALTFNSTIFQEVQITKPQLSLEFGHYSAQILLQQTLSTVIQKGNIHVLSCLSVTVEKLLEHVYLGLEFPQYNNEINRGNNSNITSFTAWIRFGLHSRCVFAGVSGNSDAQMWAVQDDHGVQSTVSSTSASVAAVAHDIVHSTLLVLVGPTLPIFSFDSLDDSTHQTVRVFRNQSSGHFVPVDVVVQPKLKLASGFMNTLQPVLNETATWLAKSLNALERYLDRGRQINMSSESTPFGEYSVHSRCNLSSAALLSVTRSTYTNVGSLPVVSVATCKAHACVLDMFMMLACFHALDSQSIRRAIFLPSPSLNRPDALSAGDGSCFAADTNCQQPHLTEAHQHEQPQQLIQSRRAYMSEVIHDDADSCKTNRFPDAYL